MTDETERQQVPVTIVFDVEPDGLDIPRQERRRWTGFERAHEIVTELRPRLSDALGTPVRFGWCLRMDPQIADVYGSSTWVADTYGRELDGLRAEGDELALHPHALRWDAATDGWIIDNANEAWVEDCVRSAFDAFAQAFGEPCRVNRFGDRHISDPLIALLRSLGVSVDMTLEPGRPSAMTSALTAPIPDQRTIPRVPYQPDPADFRRASTTQSVDGLWMLPLASADPDPALPVWRRIGRRLRHRGEPMHRPVLLWAPWPSEVLWDIVARDVEARALTALAFAVRVDTLLNTAWADCFRDHMLALPVHRLGRSVSLTTPILARAGFGRKAG